LHRLSRLLFPDAELENLLLMLVRPVKKKYAACAMEAAAQCSIHTSRQFPGLPSARYSDASCSPDRADCLDLDTPMRGQHRAPRSWRGRVEYPDQKTRPRHVEEQRLEQRAKELSQPRPPPPARAHLLHSETSERKTASKCKRFGKPSDFQSLRYWAHRPGRMKSQV